MASLAAARAEDASPPSPQAAPSKPEHQAAGACTPIGLTANGDIVFPWECRETIEKQRGPISVSIPNRSSDPPSRELSPSPDARKEDVRKEDAVTTAAAVPPKAEESTGPAAPPEVNETSALAKPGLRPTQASELGRSKFGRKRQHAAGPRTHQGSSGPAIVKKKDRVALQPAAAQR